MSRSRLAPAALLLALVCATLAAAATAQDAVPANIFLDRVEVDVVNLEVVVTDGRGNPVHGLTRDDFEVYEDGERVRLTNFYAIEGATRVGDEAPEERAAGDAEAESLLPAEQRLSLAVVIDNANTEPGSRKRVIEQLRDHLRGVLRPGDRVMLATLEPQVQVRQGFTEDVAAIDAALVAFSGTAAGRGSLQAQRQVIERSIATFDSLNLEDGGTGLGRTTMTQDSPEDAAQRSLEMIESFAGQAEAGTRRTFASLGSLVDSLAGIPGRRAVLLVSQHLSTNPVQGMIDQWYAQYSPLVPGLANPMGMSRQWDMTQYLRQVADQAAAARVTFYTLHAGGAFGDMPGAEQSALPVSSAAATNSYEREPLSHLATTTGGRMINSVNVGALIARMSADYRDYYSLGYSSPKSQDGRYHRIEVRVPGHEVELRHTEGYRAKTGEQRMRERTLSALLFDVGENPLGIKVQLMPESRRDRHWLLPVVVRVPISQLVLVPQGNEHVAQVSIAIAVRDANGGLSDPQSYELPIRIPNDRLLDSMSQEIGHGINLLVRAGDSKLAVGVRDELSAIESTLNLNVSVGGG
jgi:VWFA-related protein